MTMQYENVTILTEAVVPMSAICTDPELDCSVQTGAITKRRSVASSLKAFCLRGFAWVMAYETRRLSRLALSELTDEQLDDIGVTRAEARSEAARPFWD